MIEEEEEQLKGPPKATPARRAQSYSDFHYAVRAVLGQESYVKEDLVKGDGHDPSKEVRSELDFVDWYHDLEQDLLDSSHDEYTYAIPAIFQTLCL